MKIFLASAIAIIFTTNAFGCEIYDYSKARIMDLDCAINKIDEEFFYKHNMTFYSGYLQGQRQAFFEVKTLIDDLYPD